MYINLHRSARNLDNTVVASLERPTGSEPRTFHLTRGTQDGEFAFADMDQDLAVDVIAVLTLKADSIRLASWVDGCMVGSTQDTLQALPLPQSSRSLAAICTITTTPYQTQRQDKSKPAVPVRRKVQVESSMLADGDDSTSDELDVKGAPSKARPQSPYGHQIPSSRAAQQKETQVYSTAPDRPSNTETVAGHTPRGVPKSGERKNGSAPDSTTHQILETPLKQRSSQRTLDTGMPMPLDLAAHPVNGDLLAAQNKSVPAAKTPSLASQDTSQSHSSSIASHATSRQKRSPDNEILTSTISKRARTNMSSNLSPANTSPISHSPTDYAAPSIETKTILMTSSKYKDDKKMLAWLRKQGVHIINEVPNKVTSYTCVVSDGKLPHTGKLLRSLVLGHTIVEDEWLTASRDADELLAPSTYLPKELVASVDIDRSKILAGKTIFFTSTLHSSLGTAAWKDFEAIGMEAGAKAVDHGSSRKLRDEEADEDVLFIGDGPDDNPARQIAEQLQCNVYTKDLLKQSVLQGLLCTDDESLKIDFSPKQTPAAGRERRKQ